MTENVVLEVERASIGSTRLVRSELPELGDDQVRLRVDRFGITANNITYAAIGDMLGYWDFFPTGDAGWGRVPGIGFGTVVESNVDGVEVGSRYYGWWPMAAFHDVAAVATSQGFRDDGAHRAAHAPTYRNYVRTTDDPMYPSVADDAERDDLEDRHAILRAMVLTGFLIEEYVADLDGGPPEQLVLLSASSKTAIGVAQRAAARRASDVPASRVVGVTSARNEGFVRGLGWFDEVVTYDALSSLPVSSSAVVDMSGDSASVAAIHERLGDQVRCSLIVGKSHHDAPPAEVGGVAQEFFFAPTEVSRRMEQWGADEFGRRCAEAATAFVDGSREWMRVERCVGPSAAEDAWARAFAGDVPPDVGLSVSLGP